MHTSYQHQIAILALSLSTCVLSSSASVLSPQFWGQPVAVDEVNTSYHDKAPFLSFDGLTLYFSRADAPGWHYARIYQASRESLSAPFGQPQEISSLNSAGGHVDYPWVSPDNLRMYYYSTESGKRLRVSKRNATTDAWSRGSDVAGLSTLYEVANPTLTEDELMIVFSGYNLVGGRGGWDLWMATRPDRDSPFGDVTNLRTLNTASSDMHPSIAPDGSALYFMSNRNFPSDRDGRYQIFCAYRNSPDSQFGHVQHMALLDTPDGSSLYPSISADGASLYYCSQKDGAMADIWLSQALPTYFVDAAGGRDENDGLSPRRAFATLQKAINTAEDGDMIGVYPGVYREEIRFLGKAITVQSVADAAVIEAPEGFGVSFYMGEGPETVLRNFVIANSYVGILCIHSSPTITNVTVTGNIYGAQASGVTSPGATGSPRISNSIVWGNLEVDLEGFVDSSCWVGGEQRIPRSSESSPFRSFVPDLTADPCDFSDLSSVSLWGGLGGVSSDPLFVDPENGDYHLRSQRGRYWPEHNLWALDDVSSPCIDAGDPAADFSAEPLPNGGRLNIGAHGGTAYAERSSDPPFAGDINGDGVFDQKDYDRFMDLWQQQTDPEPSTRARR